jgi:two-component system invasion response regulator UvrY
MSLIDASDETSTEPRMILLIEDHPVVREGCRRLLEGRGGFAILEAQTGTEGLRLAAERAPAVIVLDLNLPDAGGLDMIGRLLGHNAAARILIFSMYEDPIFAARALEAGARGYVSKNDDPEAFVEAVETIARDGTYLSHAVAQKIALMSLKGSDNPMRGLTRRELDLLHLLGKGKSLGEIAGQLGISYRTAANIASNIKGKLNLSTTAELVKLAVDHGRLPL